jgi:t-SNARE complex subunit (syntaxin)
MLLPRIWQLGTCRIARAISHQTAQKQRHDIDESLFWARQIRVAKWLNWITLIAAVIAVGTVVVLICTMGRRAKGHG